MADRSQSGLLLATVDTNILVSGMIVKRGMPHAVLPALLAGTFHQVTSEDQIAELADVLKRDRIRRRYGLTDHEISEVLAFVRTSANSTSSSICQRRLSRRLKTC